MVLQVRFGSLLGFSFISYAITYLWQSPSSPPQPPPVLSRVDVGWGHACDLAKLKLWATQPR